MANTQHVAAPEVGLPTISRRRYLRYLLWATLIPLLAWLAAFPLVCSRSYEQWGETEWGPVLEFPFNPNAPNADVVIFGDSSAFLGIDPRLVNAQLGIHSVVLPSTVGSLPVIGDAPLRSYLSHHPKPKVIVLYFSPWNLDLSHAAPGRHFEGEEMMLRHGSAAEIVRYEFLHPVELIAFPIRMYSTFGSKMIVGMLHHSSRARDAEAALGHAPFLEPYPPLEDLCRIPATYLKQDSTKTVQELRARYEAYGAKVMVYLAPVPNCTNSRDLRTRTFASLRAASPVLLPPTDFAGDLYYAHVRPDLVPVASKVFADALSGYLQENLPALLEKPEASASSRVK